MPFCISPTALSYAILNLAYIPVLIFVCIINYFSHPRDKNHINGQRGKSDQRSECQMYTAGNTKSQKKILAQCTPDSLKPATSVYDAFTHCPKTKTSFAGTTRQPHRSASSTHDKMSDYSYTAWTKQSPLGNTEKHCWVQTSVVLKTIIET